MAEDKAKAPADPTVKDFLKRHVRGIPREKMKSKVFYGFKFRDLKAFINDIIAQNAGGSDAQLLTTISELELKLKSASQYKSQMEEQAQASALRIRELESSQGSAADPEELTRLQQELEAAKAQHTEQAQAGGEASQALQAKTEELDRLKGDYEKLTRENEFLDSEMEKLAEQNEALKAQLESLNAQMAADAEAHAQKDQEAQDKIQSLQTVIDQSKDMQNFLAMQEEVKRLTRALKAWELGGEFIAVERFPDFTALSAATDQVLESVKAKGEGPHLSEIETALGALKSELMADQERVQVLLEAMYEYKGSISTAYELGHLAGADEAMERGIDQLKAIVSKMP